MNLEGGCSCAAVRYKLTASPLVVHACHCRDCQRVTGSAFVINIWIEGKFVATKGAVPKSFTLKGGSGKDHEVFFCGKCGTYVWSRYHGAPGDYLFVRAGFFFSSRRRHTRLVSDWSSDVCSSDLPPRSQARSGSAGRTLARSSRRTVPARARTPDPPAGSRGARCPRARRGSEGARGSSASRGCRCRTSSGSRSPAPSSLPSSDEVFRHRHVVGTPDDERHPSVRRGRVDRHDPLVSGARAATRLLGEEGHGRRLVLEAALSRSSARLGRVEVDPAFEQCAVKVGDERADVTRRVRPARRHRSEERRVEKV